MSAMPQRRFVTRSAGAMILRPIMRNAKPMKRTPPLMAVLTTAVELAALGLGTWVTGWHAAPTKKSDGTGPVGAWAGSGEASEPGTVAATASPAQWREAAELPPLETAQTNGPLL